MSNGEEQIKTIKQNVNAGYGDVFEYKAEIDRLKAENEIYCKQINQAYDTGYNDGYDSCQDDIKQAKTDVLNRLKERYGFYSCCSWMCVVKSLTEIIDEFIKEMQNEN